MMNSYLREKICKTMLPVVFAMFLPVLITGCTTSSYGEGLQPIPGSDSDYILKIYTGGFSGGATADKAAEAEIQKFMNENGYASYEVLERRHNLVPSYFEYLIRIEDKPISRSDDRN